VAMPPGVHGFASIGPVDTGNGFFIIGDNLEASRDSRRFGVVQRGMMVGRVLAPVSRVNVSVVGGTGDAGAHKERE
ncbi:MAG: hypothetical protein JW909_06005, partial [Planctomycetes bacterium]|nr:hypothetical protein [Planctomycetota bacterium]